MAEMTEEKEGERSNRQSLRRRIQKQIMEEIESQRSISDDGFGKLLTGR